MQILDFYGNTNEVALTSLTPTRPSRPEPSSSRLLRASPWRT
ncbi:MAG: hypothetical protein ACLSHC_00240 [Bilophila wadsworthia]